MSHETWQEQLRRGTLDLAILLTVSEGSRYGLAIIQHLEAFTDLVVTEGTIYPILGRLKRDGLIESKWVESEAGHPRKYYWLNAGGRRRAGAMARYAAEFLSRIDSLIAPMLAKERK
jgi:PadR family transcriptional regulator PadR